MLRLLGTGGEGETWLCVDQRNKEEVAIKLVRRPIPRSITQIIQVCSESGACSQLRMERVDSHKARHTGSTRQDTGRYVDDDNATFKPGQHGQVDTQGTQEAGYRQVCRLLAAVQVYAWGLGMAQGAAGR